MPKYLDMPEGNGISNAYRAYVGQIERGRTVSVIRVLDEQGDYSCFVSSGELLVDLTEREALRHAVDLTHHARRRAESSGAHPVEGYTHELVDSAD